MKLPLLAPLSLLAFAALAAPRLATNASADEPVRTETIAPVAVVAAAPPAPAAPAASQWYGWQTLVADGLAVSTSFVMFKSGPDVAPWSGAGLAIGYGVGAPLVHLLHGRPWLALADLGMRVAALAVGGTIGLFTDCAISHEDSGFRCAVEGAADGAAMGVLTGAVIDATVLAWQKKPASKPSDAHPVSVTPTAPVAFTLEPSVILTRDQAGLGVRGTF